MPILDQTDLDAIAALVGGGGGTTATNVSVSIPEQKLPLLRFAPIDGYAETVTVKIRNRTGRTTIGTWSVFVDFLGTEFPFDLCLSNGHDIRFTDVDGNALSYYRVKWSKTNQIARFLVSVPAIPPKGSIIIIAHVGNASATDVSTVTNVFTRPVVDDNTIALFNFPEGSGGTSVDDTGDYTGSFGIGITWHDGDDLPFIPFTTDAIDIGGNSITSSGSNGYMVVPDLLASPPDEGSILMTYTPSGAMVNGHRFFSMYGTGASNDAVIDCSIQVPPNAIRVAKGDSSGGYSVAVSTPIELTSGRPIPIGFTWGKRGFRLYVFDSLHFKDLTDTTPPSANDGVFRLGGNISGNSLPGRISNLWVKNKQITDEEWTHYVHSLPQMPIETFANRSAKRVIIDGDNESLKWIAEPEIVLDGVSGSELLYFSAYDVGASKGYLVYADGTNFGTVHSSPLIGDDVGIAKWNRASFLIADEVTSYCFGVDANGTTGSNLRIATVTDTDTFTIATDPVAEPAGDILGFANSSVINDGGTFKCVVECAITGIWAPYLFEGTSAYKFDQVAGPLTDMQIGSGVYGGPHITKSGSDYYVFYHASHSWLLPTEVRMARTRDLENYLIYPYGPVVWRDRAEELDQTADPFVYVNGNYTDLYYEGGDNTANGDNWFIMRQRFTGTLEEFVRTSPEQIIDEVWTPVTLVLADNRDGEEIPDAATLAGQAIIITSPVTEDLEVEIYQGDDYLTGERPLTFTITGYTGPSLSGGTATLELYKSKGIDRAATAATSSYSAATVGQSSTTVTVTFNLTRTQTGAIAAVPWWYRLKGVTSGNSVITLVDDSLFKVK